MRKDFKPASYMYPQPVLMIGSYDENGVADVMNAAWGCISDYKQVAVYLAHDHKTVKNILKNVDMIMFAESLGGTETLITYPTTQTHEDTPKDVKEKLGITDCFLRMSVGIENADDIIADLERAMNS
jgi:hypothetical protein